jgi:hypothetical protein
MARTMSLLTLEALTDMLRISDTDFIKQCGAKVRARLLSSWFDKHVRVKLEQWPPLLK